MFKSNKRHNNSFTIFWTISVFNYKAIESCLVVYIFHKGIIHKYFGEYVTV